MDGAGRGPGDWGGGEERRGGGEGGCRMLLKNHKGKSMKTGIPALAWIVSQDISTSKSTKAGLHSNVATRCIATWELSSAMIRALHKSLHALQMDIIKSSEDGVWLPVWRGSKTKIIKMHKGRGVGTH